MLSLTAADPSNANKAYNRQLLSVLFLPAAAPADQQSTFCRHICAHPDSSRPLFLFLGGGELGDGVGVPCDEIQHLQSLCLHPPTYTAALLHHVCHILKHLLWHTRTCRTFTMQKWSGVLGHMEQQRFTEQAAHSAAPLRGAPLRAAPLRASPFQAC